MSIYSWEPLEIPICLDNQLSLLSMEEKIKDECGKKVLMSYCSMNENNLAIVFVWILSKPFKLQEMA